ncbi:hypothetical protein [Nocardia gipuzkoensis]|uniref:hypothetical protein n=1 Tax=Nocardia gipuzkoensis TaxID=2749991 RepID=UPI0015EE5A97|nr:hypothetical protein [Nocardia gipuzkoensis]
MLADPRIIVEPPHDVIMDLAGDVRRADAEHVADHLRDSGIAARYLRRRILTRDAPHRSPGYAPANSTRPSA